MTLLILCPVGENDMCHTVELSFIQSLSETPHLTTIRSNSNVLCGFPIFNVFLKCLPEKKSILFGLCTNTSEMFSREKNTYFQNLTLIFNSYLTLISLIFLK